MKRMALDLNKFDEMVRRKGGRIAERDDPIYSEGPSIILSSGMPRQSGQKDIVSLPIDSPSDSASPTKNENKTPKRS